MRLLCTTVTAALLLLGTHAHAKPKTAPLRAAALCYGQGNMHCVMATLQAAKLPDKPSDAAEHWRLLAMAAARMDQHTLSRNAFAQWIELDPKRHRLAKSSASPAVYKNYASAWLQVHQDKLDLRPRTLPRPAPLPAAVTQGDLPRFAPPPRSKRDKANDTVMAIGVAGAPLQGASLVGWAGLALGIEQHVGERATFGLRAAVFGRGHGPRGEDTRTGIGYGTVAVGRLFGADKQLAVNALGGAATLPDSFVGGLSVRYDAVWAARKWGGLARPYVDVTALYASQPLVGRPLVAVSLGVLIGGVKR